MSETNTQSEFEAMFAASFGEALRCDHCGRFIALEDFASGATRRMVTPDSDRSREEYETLCKRHAEPNNA
jgi:hypothetical protein